MVVRRCLLEQNQARVQLFIDHVEPLFQVGHTLSVGHFAGKRNDQIRLATASETVGVSARIVGGEEGGDGIAEHGGARRGVRRLPHKRFRVAPRDPFFRGNNTPSCLI